MLAILANRYVVYAIGAIGLVSSLWAYGAFQHRAGYAEAKQDRAFADLASFKSESERLQGLSVTIEAQLNEMRLVKPQIIERYTNVAVKNPLPVDCRIDSDRLRELNSATQAANTRKPSQPMPASK